MKDALDAMKKQGIEDDLRSAAASLSSSSSSSSSNNSNSKEDKKKSYELSVKTNKIASEIVEYLDMADYTKVRALYYYFHYNHCLYFF